MKNQINLQSSIIVRMNKLIEKRSPKATLWILATGIKKELTWKTLLPSLFV